MSQGQRAAKLFAAGGDHHHRAPALSSFIPVRMARAFVENRQAPGYAGRIDATITTLSQSDRRYAPDGRVADELILVLECERPQAGSARHRLDGVDEVVIGRGPARAAARSERRLELRVPDGRVSSAHASLVREGQAFVLHDAGAKNGVVVNGARVERQLVRDGDVIECGRTFFRYRAARERPAGDPLDVDSGGGSDEGLLTFHEPLAQQLRELAEVARTLLSVLILGASGTGKELVARAIHARSGRRGAYVGVNCAALPENLVEAELFGARRGAFTGANEDRVGLVRASAEGTLFLDEIAELPLRAQPTLLRVLQEREVLAIGTTKPQPVDLRLVAATHRDLEALVHEERFRSDLYARVAGFVVRLPTLRERIDDLGLLVAALLKRHAGGALPSLSGEAMRLLLRHSWPLNIRELEHALRAALALSPARIEAENLPAPLRAAAPAADEARPGEPPRALTPEQAARREELCALLAEHGGNISEVARRMGKDRVQIRRWIRSFGIALDKPGR